MKRRRWYCGLLAAGLALACLPDGARAQAFLGKPLEDWKKNLDPGKTPAERRSAAFALGKIGAPAQDALGGLTGRLSDDDAGVREAAAFAIGEICLATTRPHDEAVKVLCERLMSPKEEPLVRRSAAFALGAMRIGTADAMAALDAGLKARTDKTPDPCATIRQSVAWALGQVGDPAIGGLREALKDPDVFVRRDAAKALNQLSVKAARQAIPELAHSCLVPAKKEDTVQLLEMRKAGAQAVVRLLAEDKAAGPLDAKAKEVVRGPLRQLLQDTDPDVRRNAALALGGMGGPESLAALGILLEMLAEGDPALKDRPVAVLNNLGLKQQAAVALKTLGPAVEGAADQIKAALEKKDPAAVPRLINELSALIEPPTPDSPGPSAKAALPQLRPALEEMVKPLSEALALPATNEDEQEVRTWKIQQAISGYMKKALAVSAGKLGNALMDSEKSLKTIREALKKGPGAKGDSLAKQKRIYDDLQEKLAIGLISTKRGGLPAFDALLELWLDREANLQARFQAAVAMSRVADQPTVRRTIRVLLSKIEDSKDAGLPRERALWVLRVFLNNNKNEDEKKQVYESLTRVVAEPLARDKNNKMLRYDAAYLLGFFQGENVPEKALDVLAEYLKDTGTKIYIGVDVKGPKGTGEGGTGGGTGGAKESGIGDGRQLAVECLQAVTAAVVAKRPDIVAQLRVLNKDPKTQPNLQKALKALLPDVEAELKGK
jgi:HEAT repeat protein